MGLKFPHLIFYTDRMPDDFGGMANGPIIRIRPKYKDDKGLYRHEYEHVRQWYISLFTHGILYKFVRRYRKWSEAKAYATQVEGNNIDILARHMARSVYDLNITKSEARKEIEKHL